MGGFSEYISYSQSSADMRAGPIRFIIMTKKSIMSIIFFISKSLAIFPQSECLDMSQSRDRPVTFPNLIPGQTHLAFTEKGFILQKSGSFGACEILSRNNSYREAYLMVADNTGTLKLGYPGDEVCTYNIVQCHIMCVRVCVCVVYAGSCQISTIRMHG